MLSTGHTYKGSTIGLAFILFYCLASLAGSAQSAKVENQELQNPEPAPSSTQWRAEVQKAVDGAANQLQNNMLIALTGLSTNSLRVTRTAKYALGRVIISVVNHSFNFVGMVGYLPKLLTQDLPVQLITVLGLMRNETGIRPELQSSIDTVVRLVESSQGSLLSQTLIKPLTNFIPNLLSGVNGFLVTIFDGVFFLIGARDPYAVGVTRRPVPASHLPTRTKVPVLEKSTQKPPLIQT